MKFAIRDDDTSYFTKPQELEKAFGDLTGIPVSLSVIPNAKSNHGNVFPYGKDPFDREYGNVGDNLELVSYINKGIAKGKYEILMHGIHHEYYRIDNDWIPEMMNIDYSEAVTLIKKYRKYLEETFNTKINTFVAPSNMMNKFIFRALDKIGMNTMSVLSKKFDRDISIHYLKYYIKRNINKATKQFDAIGVMKYKNHKELYMYIFKDFESAWKKYNLCKKYNLPFVFYTHYWELNSEPKLKSDLCKLIEMMIADGAKPSLVNECYK